MLLLEKFIQLCFLNEGFDDVIDVIIRIRAKIHGPGSRNLRDILTDIRGLINVITVEQIGKISKKDIDGRSYATLNVKFEDDENYSVKQLLDDISDISDIDMIKFLKVDDTRKNNP